MARLTPHESHEAGVRLARRSAESAGLRVSEPTSRGPSLRVQGGDGPPKNVFVKTIQVTNCAPIKVASVDRGSLYIFSVLWHRKDDKHHCYVVTGKELLDDPRHWWGSSVGTKIEAINWGPIQSHEEAWHKVGA